MKPLDRRPAACTPRRWIHLGCLLAGLAALAGCHRDNSGLTVVRVQADWYPQPEHGGFYEALRKGYYRAEGLDVQIIPSSPYMQADALVARGISQFGLQSSDHVLQMIANANEPIVAVGASMEHDPQGIMVHAESPVHTWADLNGRTVAIRPGSAWWDFLVKKFNLTQVHEVPISYSVATFLHDPNYIQQAFATSEPYFAEREGVHTRMLMNSSAGFDPYRVFYTSTQYAHDHPDVVSKFTKASLRGWREYMADPAATNALLLKLNPALSPDWERYSWNKLDEGKFVTGDPSKGDKLGEFDPKRWQQSYEQLLALHVLKRPIDPATAYTSQFMH
jgi:NitT/TauT family transport system substrate-binding protein